MWEEVARRTSVVVVRWQGGLEEAQGGHQVRLRLDPGSSHACQILAPFLV